MTQIPFTPTNATAPPFSTVFTLDGNPYNAIATWNIAGQRWYLTLQCDLEWTDHRFFVNL